MKWKVINETHEYLIWLTAVTMLCLRMSSVPLHSWDFWLLFPSFSENELFLAQGYCFSTHYCDRRSLSWIAMALLQYVYRTKMWLRKLNQFLYKVPLEDWFWQESSLGDGELLLFFVTSRDIMQVYSTTQLWLMTYLDTWWLAWIPFKDLLLLLQLRHDFCGLCFEVVCQPFLISSPNAFV